jgi:hypothetical protein
MFEIEDGIIFYGLGFGVWVVHDGKAGFLA